MADTDGMDSVKRVRYMCEICGHVSDVLPEKCPVCGATKDNFRKIE